MHNIEANKHDILYANANNAPYPLMEKNCLQQGCFGDHPHIRNHQLILNHIPVGGHDRKPIRFGNIVQATLAVQTLDAQESN